MTYQMLSDCQIPNLSDIYVEHFGDKIGTFVEVGAFDSKSFSNTWGLAIAGWSGLYIEPVAESYLLGLSNHAKHPNIWHLNTAIGSTEGTVKISVGGPLSTTKQEMIDLFATFGWAKDHHSGNWVQVRMTTLDKALAESSIEHMDLLVIDVEGAELDVLKGFSIAGYLPRLVIIELHDINPNYQARSNDFELIKQYFADANYTPIYKDQTNTIYLRN